VNRSPRPDNGLDRQLALLLKAGTWAACAVIAAGLLLRWLSIGTHVAHATLVIVGVVLLIALPVARVALMAWWFTTHRELRFALAAAAVLLIIVVSAVVGAKIA
jgi:uncharacterized protein DUF1634